jgi:hypothetical protein
VARRTNLNFGVAGMAGNSALTVQLGDRPNRSAMDG